MSKQVERKGDNLIIHTREDYTSASKVIIMRKGETARAFYPVIPKFINNLDDIKDWSICGYRVEELYKLALILKDKRIEDVDLRDFNNCYIDGYQRAQEETRAAIQESINRIMNNLTEEG